MSEESCPLSVTPRASPDCATAAGQHTTCRPALCGFVLCRRLGHTHAATHRSHWRLGARGQGMAAPASAGWERAFGHCAGPYAQARPVRPGALGSNAPTVQPCLSAHAVADSPKRRAVNGPSSRTPHHCSRHFGGAVFYIQASINAARLKPDLKAIEGCGRALAPP